MPATTGGRYCSSSTIEGGVIVGLTESGGDSIQREEDVIVVLPADNHMISVDGNIVVAVTENNLIVVVPAEDNFLLLVEGG